MLVDHTGSQQNHLRTPEEVLVSRSGFEMLQRFAAMIASSDDAIISNTIEGTVTSWNNGAERIFGYAAHEMLGHRFRAWSIREAETIWLRVGTAYAGGNTSITTKQCGAARMAERFLSP